MKIKEIYPGLYYIKFKSQYQMAMTFIRVQEYYESPFKNIRNRFFTLEDYMDTYAEWRGNFTYPLDWDGFNIPGHIYIQWAKLFWRFSDIQQKEIDFYNKILPIIKKKKKFYLISAIHKQDLMHEIAHGLYYLNKKYKESVNKILKTNTKFYKKFKEDLLKMGYTKEVIKDEIQAYVSTDPIKDIIETYSDIIIKSPKTLQIIYELQQNFKNYLLKVNLK